MARDQTGIQPYPVRSQLLHLISTILLLMAEKTEQDRRSARPHWRWVSPMSPHSLFETHLNVRDLNRSIAFYRDVVGLELAYRLEERHVAFFWIGGRGHTMLGLWLGGSSPNAMRLHIAFSVDLEEVIAAPVALRASGVEPLDFFGQAATEPSVIGWMPAASVFFRDPDDHSLEYLAMLPHEPRPEAGVVPYGEWIANWARETSWALANHLPSPDTVQKPHKG